jgi:hypothetical protein
MSAESQKLSRMAFAARFFDFSLTISRRGAEFKDIEIIEISYWTSSVPGPERDAAGRMTEIDAGVLL